MERRSPFGIRLPPGSSLVLAQTGLLVCDREQGEIVIVKGCDAFVIVHNHPSEDPKPSEHDVRLTRDISSVARLIGLRFNDHIIIGGLDYYSFRQRAPFTFE